MTVPVAHSATMRRVPDRRAELARHDRDAADRRMLVQLRDGRRDAVADAPPWP